MNLDFIYAKTISVYSHTGKPSIDPVVFFKCLLIEYFENLCYDRAIERAISLRLDLLYFIDHNIGERPPDHKCSDEKELKFRYVRQNDGHYKKYYSASVKDCRGCPLANECANKRGLKRIEHTVYKEDYIEMIERMKSKKRQASYALRMQSVEPVFGTLQQHYDLRFINM